MIGSAADGQTWTTSGAIVTANAGEFTGVPTRAMLESFKQLTKGNAVYGKPGLGCRGPYSMKRLVIEDISVGEELPVQMPAHIGRAPS
jgi:hypothetical protein